ncbi:MAG: prepilin-type N-terminal cleavage/methylation domain-containing protein [Candidatus Omnitrophota bacterium]|nr:MAG: prepilin-type N-terminal cleavage/methylation domain-containing protein [Candidatus Omnitrophota bacterium]
MKRRSFTLVEIMIVVAIIALLAAIAIPNLLRPRLVANEAKAQATLRTISTAAETYAAANNGNYPTAMSDLTDATPAYLSTDYTTSVTSGYNYTCGTMTATAYSCTAVAATCNTTGSQDFTITTGGVLSSAACT